MASEKSKHGEKLPTSTFLPQRSPEVGFFNMSDEAADSTWVADDSNGVGSVNMPPYILPPFPPFSVGNIHGMPQSYPQETLLPGIYPFSSAPPPMINHDSIDRKDIYAPCGPVLDFPHSQRNMNEFGQHDTFEDLVASGDIEMCWQAGEVKSSITHRPQFIGNSISCGGSTPLLSHTPDVGEMVSKNRGMTSAAQSDFPEKLDGSFLTLRVGGNTEASSRSNFSSGDITCKSERAVCPQSNIFRSPNAYRNSLNPVLEVGSGGFPTFQNTVDGFSSQAQNASGFSSLALNLCGFSSLAQNVSSWTSSNIDIGVTGCSSTGFSLSSSHMLQKPQVDKEHHFFMPDDRNLGLERNRDSRRANIDPNKCFQAFPPVSALPLSSSLAGLPDSGQCSVPGLPSSASLIMRSTTQLAYDQLQNCAMGTSRNLSSQPSMVSPFVDDTGSNTRQDLSYRPFPASNMCASQVPKGGLFSPNIGVQSTGQITPLAVGSGPAQASNIPVGSSIKRSATRPPPATPRVQRRITRSTKTFINPSILNLAAQAAPSLSPLAKTASLPIAQTAPLPSPLAHTAFPIPPLGTAPLPPMAKTILPYSPHHIKWQGLDKTPEPSGEKCFICKRDLSYTPEGPVFQPTVPPAIAVLPCGHCFHDHCLKLITSQDEAKNPPCIPCAIGES